MKGTMGKRVTTLAKLHSLALCKRSVVVKPMEWRTPAAFLMSMQASRVFRMIRAGVYEYRPNKSKRPKWASRNREGLSEAIKPLLDTKQGVYAWLKKSTHP